MGSFWMYRAGVWELPSMVARALEVARFGCEAEADREDVR